MHINLRGEAKAHQDACLLAGEEYPPGVGPSGRASDLCSAVAVYGLRSGVSCSRLRGLAWIAWDGLSTGICPNPARLYGPVSI